jgi:outer membrane lipoprotein-sorting protein
MLACLIQFVLIVGPIFVSTIVEKTVRNTAEHNSGIASLAAKVN